MVPCVERKSFGIWLRTLRERENLSQQRLADTLGCNRIHVWRLENGQRNPSRMLLHALERILSLAAEDRETLIAFKQMMEYDCDAIYLE